MHIVMVIATCLAPFSHLAVIKKSTNIRLTLSIDNVLDIETSTQVLLNILLSLN